MCEHMSVLWNMWALQQEVKVLSLNVSDRENACVSKCRCGAHLCTLMKPTTWAGHAAVIGWRWGSVVVSFVSLGRPTPTLFHPWHPWHGAFLSDWWPNMTEGFLHAYNQLMRPAAAPRDWKARNVNEKKTVPKIMREKLKSSIYLQQI